MATGIHPLCEQCKGACCKYFYIVVNRNDSPDMRKYRKLHGLAHVGGGKWIVPLKCEWLDDNGRCKDYENRPAMCREARVGDAVCLQARQVFGKKEVVENGSGTGQEVSVERKDEHADNKDSDGRGAV